MEDESRSAPAAPAADAADAADAAGDTAACYVERLADIGADSPLFAAFYDADAGVWAWRLAWVDSAGRMRVVEGDIPDELLRDDGDDDAAPDLHAAIVAARAAVQGFCEAYADEDPALAAILDALDAEERGDDAAVAAAAARLAAPVAAADDAAGRWSDPTA